MDAETKRRISAARGYLGEQRPAFAKRLGMTASTLRRYEEEPNYPKTIKPHQQEALLRKIAEITGLPYEFFTVDFARLAALTAADSEGLIIGEASEGGKVRPISLAELVQLLREELAGEELPAPRGELGRDAQDSRPTDERPAQTESQKGQDEKRADG